MSYRHHIGPAKAAYIHGVLADLLREIDSRKIETTDESILAAIDVHVLDKARFALQSITPEEAEQGEARQRALNPP